MLSLDSGLFLGQVLSWLPIWVTPLWVLSLGIVLGALILAAIFAVFVALSFYSRGQIGRQLQGRHHSLAHRRRPDFACSLLQLCPPAT